MAVRTRIARVSFVRSAGRGRLRITVQRMHHWVFCISDNWHNGDVELWQAALLASRLRSPGTQNVSVGFPLTVVLRGELPVPMCSSASSAPSRDVEPCTEGGRGEGGHFLCIGGSGTAWGSHFSGRRFTTEG